MRVGRGSRSVNFRGGGAVTAGIAGFEDVQGYQEQEGSFQTSGF